MIRTSIAGAVACFCLAILGFPFSASAIESGDILVADPAAFGGPGGIIDVNPLTGTKTELSSSGNFLDPVDITVDMISGRIFVADAGAGAIIEIDPSDGSQAVLAVGGHLISPSGIVSGLGRDLWVCDAAAAAVVKIDQDSGAQELMSSGDLLTSPTSIGIDKFGSLFVTDRSAAGGGAVIRIDSDGSQTLIAEDGNLKNPTGISAELRLFGGLPIPLIFVSDRGGGGSSGGIIAVDYTDGDQTLVIEGEYEDVEFHNGDLHLYALLGAGNIVHRIDPFDPIAEVIAEDSIFAGPTGLDFYFHDPVQSLESTWGKIKAQYR